MVVVDSTLQPKAIAHPTDSRVLEVTRQKLVEVAKSVGISLNQTCSKENKPLTRKVGGYAHARQLLRWSLYKTFETTTTQLLVVAILRIKSL
jgi:transposase, IS5 family